MTNRREIITSRQNPSVQKLCALLDKKERKKSHLFRIDGHKLFTEAVVCGARIDTVFLREDKADLLGTRVSELCPDCRTLILSNELFSRISEERAPEGIVATVGFIDRLHHPFGADGAGKLARSEKRIMAFESLRDPGNLGTVIRSASAFGVDTLLLSSDCADIYNSKTLRGAMGAVFSREILLCDDLPATLCELKREGRRVLAATLAPDSAPLGGIGLSGRDIVVIGNEGHGLGESTIAVASARVILPMNSGPGVESLNAATAASVFMWEQMRVSAENGG